MTVLALAEPAGAPVAGEKHDPSGVPPSPPCAGSYTRGARLGLCMKMPRSGRVRSHHTTSGQSHGKRCRIPDTCETPGGHRAWGCGVPGRRTGPRWLFFIMHGGVVQWQNGSFPSFMRGFYSLHPLHFFAPTIGLRSFSRNEAHTGAAADGSARASSATSNRSNFACAKAGRCCTGAYQSATNGRAAASSASGCNSAMRAIKGTAAMSASEYVSATSQGETCSIFSIASTSASSLARAAAFSSAV
jgi:hypothetical protein